MEFFEEVIELDPQNALAHSNLATSLTNLHKYDDALQLYSEFLKLEPKSKEIYEQIGNIYRL